MKHKIFDEIVNKYRAQIGETVWHAFTGDELIDKKSNQFYSNIEKILASKFGNESFKVLELAPSKNYIGCLIAENFNADVTIMDLSKQALIDGKLIADKKGFKSGIKRVACDFHNLPFQAETFDFVYMAGAIHHSKVPEKILEEIARVLKPGGFFNSINEPCKRAFSLYAFSSNRGVLPEFENILLQEGVLGVFSYPVNGSRPEDLFGIVENWSISIDDFHSSQKKYLDVVDEEYEWGPLSEFESNVLESRKLSQSEIKDIVFEKIIDVRKKALPHLGDKEKLMGFYFPGDAEISALVDEIVPLLKNSDLDPASNNYDRSVTNLFGGRIKNLLYKRNNTIMPDKAVQEMHTENDISVAPLIYQGATLDLTGCLLPTIQNTEERDDVEMLFSKSDWDVITEADGVVTSCINMKPDPVIRLNDTYNDVVLCVRYYAIETDEPYTVEIYSDGNKIDSQEICRSETRCAIIPLTELSSDVVFNIKDSSGELLDMNGYIRVGVFQLIKIYS